jgi:hypothetical protein
MGKISGEDKALCKRRGRISEGRPPPRNEAPLTLPDINVMMGAGVYPDQADKTLILLNQNTNLKKYFYEINSEALPDVTQELWRPPAGRVNHSSLVAFANFLEEKKALKLRYETILDFSEFRIFWYCYFTKVVLSNMGHVFFFRKFSGNFLNFC